MDAFERYKQGLIADVRKYLDWFKCQDTELLKRIESATTFAELDECQQTLDDWYEAFEYPGAY